MNTPEDSKSKIDREDPQKEQSTLFEKSKDDQKVSPQRKRQFRTIRRRHGKKRRDIVQGQDLFSKPPCGCDDCRVTYPPIHHNRASCLCGMCTNWRYEQNKGLSSADPYPLAHETRDHIQEKIIKRLQAIGLHQR